MVAVTAYFTYDAAGQRVRKVWEHSWLVEERIYLGGYEVYQQGWRATGGAARAPDAARDGWGAAHRAGRDEDGGCEWVGRLCRGPVTRYQLGNHLGSAALEVDETGLVISYEEYHPYGTTAYAVGTEAAEVSRKRYRYTGKERDEETGLYYHGARYYAPWLGRWTSADPAGMVDGPNLYQYVREPSVRLTNPSGTATEEPSLWQRFKKSAVEAVNERRGSLRSWRVSRRSA